MGTVFEQILILGWHSWVPLVTWTLLGGRVTLRGSAMCFTCTNPQQELRAAAIPSVPLLSSSLHCSPWQAEPRSYFFGVSFLFPRVSTFFVPQGPFILIALLLYLFIFFFTKAWDISKAFLERQNYTNKTIRFLLLFFWWAENKSSLAIPLALQQRQSLLESMKRCP